MKNIKNITQYQEVNEAISFLVERIQNIFGNDLVGLYLTGSLSYGDFDIERSDIDLVAFLRSSVSSQGIKLIKQLHSDFEIVNNKWSKRFECSFTPVDALKNVIISPKEPRPYISNGIFYPGRIYGNEWVINNFFLYKYGIVVIGPDFKTLAGPIDIKDVREACIRDLHKEWEPILTDPSLSDYLDDSHQQSYVVLNLCRILYTVLCNDAVSKKIATSFTKKQFPQWADLIETADSWYYGIEMKRQKEIMEFIKFTITEVNRQSNP